MNNLLIQNLYPIFVILIKIMHIKKIEYEVLQQNRRVSGISPYIGTI